MLSDKISHKLLLSYNSIYITAERASTASTHTNYNKICKIYFQCQTTKAYPKMTSRSIIPCVMVRQLHDGLVLPHGSLNDVTEPLFHTEAHEILAGQNAHNVVVAVHYRQVTQSQSAEDDVGSVERELVLDADG